jgi:hypothetical protein
MTGAGDRARFSFKRLRRTLSTPSELEEVDE